MDGVVSSTAELNKFSKLFACSNESYTTEDNCVDANMTWSLRISTNDLNVLNGNAVVVNDNKTTIMSNLFVNKSLMVDSIRLDGIALHASKLNILDGYNSFTRMEVSRKRLGNQM